MPGKKTVFTPSSILFRPQRPCRATFMTLTGENLVEAPGTAPGSEWLIPQSVYHHSRAGEPVQHY